MRLLIFLLHGGRSGSEVLLYNLIRHADRRKITMAVACAHEGALLKDLPADVPVFVHSHLRVVEHARNGAGGARRLYNRALNSIYHRAYRQLYEKSPAPLAQTTEEKITRIHETFEPDAWYVNTLAQPDVLRLARAMNVPVVLHSHELEHMLWPMPPEDVDNIVNYPALVIASSEAAANVLRALGRTDNLEVCHESIEVAQVRSDEEAAREVRKRLGIGEDQFVWLMSGALEPNKNPALFIDLAREFSAVAPEAHLLWLGGWETGYSMFVKGKARLAGINERVSWVHARTQDYYDYLNAADGFVLTSTRDCFPLVMIEAAALGKPIVSFDSGGVREFVTPGVGLVVASWNAADLARACVRTMNGQIGFDPLAAKRRAAEFDVGARVKRWESLLEGYLSALRSSPNERVAG